MHCLFVIPDLQAAIHPARMGQTSLAIGAAKGRRQFPIAAAQRMNQFVNLSSFAEQLLIGENALVKIRPDMPLDKAALLGCGVTTGLGAVFNSAGVEPGRSVAVVGVGGVGLAAIQGARIAGAARIIAVDLLPMDALPSVEFVQGDFTEDETLEALKLAIGDDRVDLVMSDMAPNISGTRAVDQPRSMYLAELALDMCREVLGKGGDFVCKLFQGEGIDAFIGATRQVFQRVRAIKPKASRPGSREVYLVARNYRL